MKGWTRKRDTNAEDVPLSARQADDGRLTSQRRSVRSHTGPAPIALCRGSPPPSRKAQSFTPPRAGKALGEEEKEPAGRHQMSCLPLGFRRKGTKATAAQGRGEDVDSTTAGVDEASYIPALLAKEQLVLPSGDFRKKRVSFDERVEIQFYESPISSCSDGYDSDSDDGVLDLRHPSPNISSASRRAMIAAHRPQATQRAVLAALEFSEAY